jgi:uncharacterized protein with GYD domain
MKADPAAAAKILHHGSAGAQNQREVIEGLHGRVLGYYLVAGPFDLVMFVELPDDSLSVLLSLMAAAHGFDITPMRAFQVEELDGMLTAYSSRAAEAQRKPRRSKRG